MPKPKKLADLDLSPKGMAQLIDFSVLNSDASKEDIDRGIDLSIKYGFKGFHTNTFWSEYVADRLEGTGIEAAYPVSFPFGCVTTELKVAEAIEGSKKMRGRPWVIDMVANHGMLKSGEYDYYKNDIAEVCKVAHDGGAQCKAILEVQLLTDDQIKAAVELASEAGVDFVKSSTGRHGGPSMHQVKLMCDTAPENVEVKVAGTGSFWTPMVVLGCMMLGVTRIGTRNGPAIVDDMNDLVVPLLNL